VQYFWAARSNNAGATWDVFDSTKLPPNAGDRAAGAFPFDAPFAVDPANPNQLIAGGSGTIWTTPDWTTPTRPNGTSNWRRLLLGIPGSAAATSLVTYRAAVPVAGEPTRFYAGFANGMVYYGEIQPNGFSITLAIDPRTSPWQNNPVRSIAVDPFDW